MTTKTQLRPVVAAKYVVHPIGIYLEQIQENAWFSQAQKGRNFRCAMTILRRVNMSAAGAGAKITVNRSEAGEKNRNEKRN